MSHNKTKSLKSCKKLKMLIMVVKMKVMMMESVISQSSVSVMLCVMVYGGVSGGEGSCEVE